MFPVNRGLTPAKHRKPCQGLTHDDKSRGCQTVLMLGPSLTPGPPFVLCGAAVFPACIIMSVVTKDDESFV